MMKQEFEKRIGLVITTDEYAEIEAAYMGLPDSVNKDKFVKIWLGNGGIQDLFDKRQLRIRQLQEAVIKQRHEMENELEYERNHERYFARLWQEEQAKVKALEAKLATIVAAIEGVAV